MNQKQFENLQRGNLVRHKARGDAYVIEMTHPVIVALRHVQVTNPTEWHLLDANGLVIDAPSEDRRYTVTEIFEACSVSNSRIYAPSLIKQLEKLP